MSSEQQTAGGQPRVPGVKYDPVTRYRKETTTINGRSSTRDVPYTEWVPRPPADVETRIVQGVTYAAVGTTFLTVTGTVAAIGGLLHEVVPGWVAYSVTAAFDVTWLCCTAMQYVHKRDPQRAKKAEVFGRFSLALCMAGIVAFGAVKHHLATGIVAGLVPLLNKGLWSMVIDSYTVPLSAGVSHWLRTAKEEMSARSALAEETRRLDGQERYNLAVYGPAAVAAASAITTTESTPELPGPADAIRTVSGEVIAPASAPVSAPSVPPVPPVPPTQAPVPQPTPAAAPPVVPALAVPAAAAPAAAAPVPVAHSTAPVVPPAVVPPVFTMPLSIRKAVYVVLDGDAVLDDEALCNRVATLTGKDRATAKKFDSTVQRYRREWNNQPAPSTGSSPKHITGAP